jgi:tetratricopeptide (TPR) repeat protein/predicted aspartyl protease
MCRGWRLAGVLGLALASAAPAARACTLGKLAELPVTMHGLVPTVPVKVDGADITLLADSGGFFSLLTPQAAGRAGLHVGPAIGVDSVVGLAGQERAGVATAKDFSLAGYTFHHADFLVAAPQLGQAGVDGILGDNILSYADLEFDLANGAIRMFKPIGCSARNNFAYWAPNNFETADIAPAVRPSFKIIVNIKVNGHEMKAVLDSGAGRSFITRTAARAAGVSVDSAGVKPTGMGGGIGHRDYQTWLARFDSFAVGDELIKNAMLRIGDAEMADAQMLLGADFLLSHRVYVANSERKLFFSYLGGPVFNLDEDSGASPAQQQAAAPPPAVPGAPPEKPTDAEGFARRAAAFDARHEYTAAIADYSQAMGLQPADAHFVFERGVEYLRNKEPDAALSDFDATLKLKPDDADALMSRASLRLDRKDESGADADFEAAARLKSNYRLGAAFAYQQARLFEKSVAEYGRWIADNPKAPGLAEALNGRCWVRALWGKELDQALADCSAAIQRDPGTSAFRDSRGLVYLRLGQYQASIADYDAALRMQPKQPWSLYGRGLDKLRLGRLADGHADLAAAAAVAPDLPETAKGYGIVP